MMGKRKGIQGISRLVLFLAPVLLGGAWAAAEGMPYRILENTGAGGGQPCPGTPWVGGARFAKPFVAGGKMLFVATDSANGQDLWASDGTTTGTGRLKDIVPTSPMGTANPTWDVNNLEITHVVPRGSVAYFRKLIDPHCGTWYRTDGTTEGTIPVDDLNLHLKVNAMDGSCPVLDTGTDLYFFYLDDANKPQLWRTDFTDAGSCKITDSLNLGTIDPAFGINQAGPWVCFAARDSSGNNWVCRTDGTVAGTSKLAKTAPLVNWLGNTNTQVVGNKLFFVCKDAASGTELWKTDGTAAGTAMVKDIRPGGADGLMQMDCGLYPPNAALLFFEADDGVHGRRLWRTDGTSTGTCPLPDPLSNPNFSSSVFLGQLGSHSYLMTTGTGAGSKNGIIRTDGVTSESVAYDLYSMGRFQAVGDALYFFEGLYGNLCRIGNESLSVVQLTPDGSHFSVTSGVFVPMGPWIYFWTDNSLWRTNGTPDGTTKIAAMPCPDWAAALDGILFTNDFWKSDGTPEGTVSILPDCPPATSVPVLNPRILGTVGARAILCTQDVGGGGGLWVSDGTAAGTTLLKTFLGLNLGQNGHPDSKPYAFSVPYMYFAAVSDSQNGRWELWRTDGTPEGTVKVAELGTGGVNGMAAGGAMVYISTYENGQFPLWKSDGTAAGTVKILQNCDYGATHLTMVDSTLYFSTYISPKANLWSSDGTTAGTRKLAQYPKPDPNRMENSSLDFLTPLGGRLFFLFTYPSGANHTSLWDFRPHVCNGPTSIPFRPKDATAVGWYNPAKMPVMGANAYFGLWDEAHGLELWKTDGTSANTTLVKDLCPGPAPSFIGGMAWAILDSNLYFNAADATHGMELWKTDGTADGTALIKDINPGTVAERGVRCPDQAGSVPHEMFTCNGSVYFAAADGITGTELWRTRGAAETTVRLAEIAPGPASSNPAQFALAGDRLLFTATDGTDRGTEVWAMALPTKSPANPGAVMPGQNSIVWTWEDTSADEGGFKVWSDAGTSIPVTLRVTAPANSTSWRQDGLDANMPYSFQVASTGENGDSQPTTPFTAWTLAPDPTGLQFAQVTGNSIHVTLDPVPANLAQEQSGMYLLNQTRGLNSGWMQTASGWNSTGLSPNRPYTFVGRARNGAGVETLPATGTKYTLAATPNAPVVDNPGVHTLDVSGMGGSGNPSYTLYAVQFFPGVDGDNWVQGDGSSGSEAFFQTAGAWGTVTVAGLAENTLYTFRAVARNSEGVDTEPGAPGACRTLDITPPTAAITLVDPNPLDSDTVRFGVTFDEPVGTSFSPGLIALVGTLPATLADPNADGTIGMQIGAGVTDLSGNTFAGGSSELYTLTHWAGFTRQPVGARKYRGESHLLQVAVDTGGLPTTFLWKHLTDEGNVIDGPDAEEWQLSVLSAGDSGGYWCEVTNGGATHPSQKVTVSAMGHLRITKQPQGGGGFYGESWTFSVEADGGYAPLHYQWRKGQQQDCPDGNEPVCVIGPLEPGDEGLYNVEIHDSNTDTQESYPVRLTLARRIPLLGNAGLTMLAGFIALVGAWRIKKRRPKTSAEHSLRSGAGKGR